MDLVAASPHTPQTAFPSHFGPLPNPAPAHARAHTHTSLSVPWYHSRALRVVFQCCGACLSWHTWSWDGTGSSCRRKGRRGIYLSKEECLQVSNKNSHLFTFKQETILCLKLLFLKDRKTGWKIPFKHKFLLSFVFFFKESGTCNLMAFYFLLFLMCTCLKNRKVTQSMLVQVCTKLNISKLIRTHARTHSCSLVYLFPRGECFL